MNDDWIEGGNGDKGGCKGHRPCTLQREQGLTPQKSSAPAAPPDRSVRQPSSAQAPHPPATMLGRKRDRVIGSGLCAATSANDACRAGLPPVSPSLILLIP